MAKQLTIDFEGKGESQFSLCAICGNLCLPDAAIIEGEVLCELCEDVEQGQR